MNTTRRGFLGGALAGIGALLFGRKAERITTTMETGATLLEPDAVVEIEEFRVTETIARADNPYVEKLGEVLMERHRAAILEHFQRQTKRARA